MKTSLINRNEAYASIDKELRYRQILDILSYGDMSAKEIAVEMFKRKYTPTAERNFAAPRLTELVKKGKVAAIRKKKCSYTGKNVTVYSKCDIKPQTLKDILKQNNLTYEQTAALLSNILGQRVNKGEISLILSGKSDILKKALRRYIKGLEGGDI